MEMKDLIQRIAEALVDSPEQVTVTAIEGSQATVLELKVAQDDLGKIIGKQGRTAKSIRRFLKLLNSFQAEHVLSIKARTAQNIVPCVPRRAPS
jgi:predicted RNA-binding protein YlqC (UPF0109 family)